MGAQGFIDTDQQAMGKSWRVFEVAEQTSSGA
jgi:hypothetical protein